MIGEGLPEQNGTMRYDFVHSGIVWPHPNSGVGHGATVIPINYVTDSMLSCQPRDRALDNWALSLGMKSNHAGGINVVFGDGSVHFISQNIDHRLYNQLGCRHDGAVVTLP